MRALSKGQKVRIVTLKIDGAITKVYDGDYYEVKAGTSVHVVHRGNLVVVTKKRKMKGRR